MASKCVQIDSHNAQVSGLFAALGSCYASQNDNNGVIKQFYPNITSNHSQNNGTTMPLEYEPVEYDYPLIEAEPVPPFDDPYSNGSESEGTSEQPEHDKLVESRQRPISIGSILAPHGHAMLWHVGVYSKRFAPYMQICGGTLVTTKAVVSAAHCFWSDEEGALPAEDFAVGVGKRLRPWNVDRDYDSQKSDVEAIHIPVRYRDAAASYQEDIAVLLMSKEFRVSRAVRPACVNFDEYFDNEQLKEGNLGTVLGWGLTKEDGDPSQLLNYLELPTVSVEECLRIVETSFVRYITSDKICAGVTTGKALCRGDSGGGLVFLDHRGSRPIPYLRGVASTAPRNDHECNAHALAALTHVRAHRAFLRRYIANLEDECKRHYPIAEALKDRCNTIGPVTCEPIQVTCNCFCGNTERAGT